MIFFVKVINQLLSKIVYFPIRKAMLKKRESIERAIPKVELEERHIRNARLLKDRLGMLELLPKNGFVAELGVDNGDFSSQIIKYTIPQKLHLVDIWNTKRYGEEKKKHVEERFMEEINKQQVEIDLGLSTDVVSQFPDKYFNWIYIDTSHNYCVTKQELEMYQSKIKDGGIMAGHDYVRWDRAGFGRYGVIEAVSEFCVRYDWEILYLTVENNDNPSFAIRKISSK